MLLEVILSITVEVCYKFNAEESLNTTFLSKTDFDFHDWAEYAKSAPTCTLFCPLYRSAKISKVRQRGKFSPDKMSDQRKLRKISSEEITLHWTLQKVLSYFTKYQKKK